MKYCEEYGALLDAYVDGELSRPDTLRVAKHLKTCGGCRSYVDAALAIRAAFPDEEDEAVPAEFAAGVLSAVREAPRETNREAAPTVKKPYWKRLALPLAACLALAVIAGQGGWFSVQENFQPTAAMAQDASTAGTDQDTTETAPAAPAGEGGPATKTRSASGAADVEGKAAARTEESVQEAENDASDVSGVDAYQYVASSADRAENALSAAPVMNDVNAEKEHAISVTLTQEQGNALAPLLSDCTLESSGENVVYLLTAKRFQEVLAELERQNIPASVTEASDNAPYRLYIQYK